MRSLLAHPFATLALACLLPTAAWAQAPQRDLTIELRQIRESQAQASTAGSAYIVGTASRGADFEPQQVRVRSGEKASLAISQSQPMQWVQKIEAQSATLNAASASASSTTGGVTQGLVWMESGQQLRVTPHWNTGQPSAKLEIEMQAAVVDERTGADLPASKRQHLSTTVTAPLGQWVTLASSGKAAKPGTYSSAGSGAGRTLVQIRVTPD